MISTSVVFPEPVNPTKATDEPAGISRSRFSNSARDARVAVVGSESRGGDERRLFASHDPDPRSGRRGEDHDDTDHEDRRQRGVEVTGEGDLQAVEVGPDRAREAGAVSLSVRNAGVIAPDVQARIFQRSFSTKAVRGRGLGTYSMKLFGERYLGGEVSFSSSPGAGTVFTVRVPA